MHFVRRGQGRPALIFVHGFACSHEDWQAQIDFFSKSQEVVACDLRGHGATPGRPQECSIEHYGGDVAALAGHLDLPRVILVGHSMGCRVVLEAARLDPERIAGLVLVDGSRQGMGDPEAAERNARAALQAKGYAAFMRPFFEAMFLRKSAQSEAVVERALQLPSDVGSALFPRMARWDAGSMEAAVQAARVPVLAVQCTYVNTERKRVPIQPGDTTPWLDLLKARVKDLNIEILSGLGHFPQLEVPDRLNRLLSEFCARAR
ncbi:MAG TPA: alpha/beta hydrolase [Burkholderiales bacterium]|nr:alpha/beta hydrolase [Burkholderiales bacterium]